MVRTKKRHAGTRHSAAKTRSADLISERQFIHMHGPDAFKNIKNTWNDPISDHVLIIKDYADKHKRQRMEWGSQFGLPWTTEQSEKARAPPMEGSRASKNTNMAPDHDSITEQMATLKLMGGTRRTHRRRGCRTHHRRRRTHRRRN